MIKSQISEMCKKAGVPNSYRLQQATGLSSAVTLRLFKGEFEMIGMKTMDTLCRVLKCQPGDLFQYRHGTANGDKGVRKKKPLRR